LVVIVSLWGTDIRGLMRGTATLFQGNQKPLVVKAELAGQRADERHSNPPPR